MHIWNINTLSSSKQMDKIKFVLSHSAPPHLWHETIAKHFVLILYVSVNNFSVM